MKVAIVTDDGDYVSQHFGRAKYYKIYTIEDGAVTETEMRQRGTGHHAPNANQQEQQQHQATEADSAEGHGYTADAVNKHRSMAAEIADCKALIAGGMGSGAYESFTSAGLDVIMTKFSWTEEAITAYIENKIENLVEQRTH